jgi:hypothetical protein
MALKPFKGRVRVVTRGTQDHLYHATAEEAETLCRKGFAVQIAGEFTAFVGLIELTLSLGEVREHFLPLRPAKNQRPKPNLSAESSTGDAGRGWTHARRQTVHFRPTA